MSGTEAVGRMAELRHWAGVLGGVRAWPGGFEPVGVGLAAVQGVVRGPVHAVTVHLSSTGKDNVGVLEQ